MRFLLLKTHYGPKPNRIRLPNRKTYSAGVRLLSVFNLATAERGGSRPRGRGRRRGEERRPARDAWRGASTRRRGSRPLPQAAVARESGAAAAASANGG